MTFRLPMDWEWRRALRDGDGDGLPDDWNEAVDDLHFLEEGSYLEELEKDAEYKQLKQLEEKYEWSCASSPVGWSKPTPDGVYDMIGNVSEWTMGQDGKPISHEAGSSDQNEVNGFRLLLSDAKTSAFVPGELYEAYWTELVEYASSNAPFMEVFPHFGKNQERTGPKFLVDTGRSLCLEANIDLARGKIGVSSPVRCRDISYEDWEKIRAVFPKETRAEIEADFSDKRKRISQFDWMLATLRKFREFFDPYLDGPKDDAVAVDDDDDDAGADTVAEPADDSAGDAVAADDDDDDAGAGTAIDSAADDIRGEVGAQEGNVPGDTAELRSQPKAVKARAVLVKVGKGDDASYIGLLARQPEAAGDAADDTRGEVGPQEGNVPGEPAELRFQLKPGGGYIVLEKVGEGEDAFYIGRSIVTDDQWDAVNPKIPYYSDSYRSFGSARQLSLENVFSVSTTRIFCERLNEIFSKTIGGWRFRLPTRREWSLAVEHAKVEVEHDVCDWGEVRHDVPERARNDGPLDPSIGLPGYGFVGGRPTDEWDLGTRYDDVSQFRFRVVLESPASRLRSAAWEKAVLDGYHARLRYFQTTFRHRLENGTGRRFDLGKGVMLDLVGGGRGAGACYVSRFRMSNSVCMRLAEIAEELKLCDHDWFENCRARFVSKSKDPYFEAFPAEVSWWDALFFTKVLNHYLLWERGGFTFSIPYESYCGDEKGNFIRARRLAFATMPKESPLDCKAAIGPVDRSEVVGMYPLAEYGWPNNDGKKLALGGYWLASTDQFGFPYDSSEYAAEIFSGESTEHSVKIADFDGDHFYDYHFSFFVVLAP